MDLIQWKMKELGEKGPGLIAVMDGCIMIPQTGSLLQRADNSVFYRLLWFESTVF